MLKSIWKTCCSLKLAIFMASICTLLTMGGSLVMHFNPATFEMLDTTTLMAWTESVGKLNPGLSWWLYVTGSLVILLAINTACCFIDWLLALRSRWRKSGEYLIHIGFVMVIVAYFWGSLAGARSPGNQLAEGELAPLTIMPGYYLRLDKFELRLNEKRRPIDMLNTVSLLHGDTVVARDVVKTNSPLLFNGLVITPASFGQQTIGYEVLIPRTAARARLLAGDTIQLPGDLRLVADAFYPDVVESGGRIFSRSQEVRRPAYQMRLLEGTNELWRGLYFMTGPPPEIFRKLNIQLIIIRPVFKMVSSLTINRDPGALLALVGGLSISLGVFLALFSFYFKRSRGDRPEIV